MCFGKSKNQLGGDELAKSQEIDKMIRNDQRKLNKEIKLLLLGPFSCALELWQAAARLKICFSRYIELTLSLTD